METMTKDKQYIKDIEPLGSCYSSSGSVCEEIPTQDINYYINRIQDAITDYSEEHNKEDIYKLSKTRWNAVLIYIYNKVFKPIVIKRETSIIPYKDINLLNQLADYYIFLCNEYNKDVSINGFSKLIGISYMTLYQWNKRNNRSRCYIDIDNNNYMIAEEEVKTYQMTYPNNRVIELSNIQHDKLIKKLTAEREQSLKSITLDGSIPALALGKIEYAWIEGGLQQKQAEMLDNYTAPTALLDTYRNGNTSGTQDVV